MNLDFTFSSPRVEILWRLTGRENPFLVVRDTISGLCASVTGDLTVRWFFGGSPLELGLDLHQHARGGFVSLDDALRFAATRVWGEPPPPIPPRPRARPRRPGRR